MNVIELNQISKKYRNAYAIQNVTLQIPKGSIYGLIGHNGAGKSTLMKLVCGAIHPTNGTISLFGNDPSEDPYAYRRIGALIETSGFYPSMNAYDNMKIKALALGCEEKQHIQQ